MLLFDFLHCSASLLPLLLLIILCPRFPPLLFPSSSSLSSTPLLLFVRPFSVGHKRRRRTSFPVAWSHTGVADIHIYCTLCILCNMWAIHTRTYKYSHYSHGEAAVVYVCFIRQRRYMCHNLTNICLTVCSHNSLKSICGQGVFSASSLSYIYMHLLFRMPVHILLELNSS